MRYIVKTAIFLCIALGFVYSTEVSVTELILLFSLLIATVFTDTKSKSVKIAAVIVECFILYFVGLYTDFLFYGILILIFDCIYLKLYYFGLSAAGLIIYYDLYIMDYLYWLLLGLVGVIAFALKKEADNQIKYYNILDNERRTKYDLELAQQKLIKSNKEVEKLAEEKERNRIARDVHDNVGHSIAGILIKLQATKKVLEKDKQKGDEMLDECVVHLQDSLQMLRDTVHNMYKHQSGGTEQIESIVDNYKYCNAEIKSTGQFDNCNEKVFKVLSYVLKEALTNTAKHSEANNVYIELKGTDTEVNLDIKDDGIGCDDINESLGTRSMRDRIKGLGGTLEIDGRDGMHIVCSIPIGRE